MKIRLALPLAILMGLLISASAFAQDAVITGRVTHEDGPPIANATLTIAELGLSATTDTSGNYTLTVPAGSVRGQTVEMRVVAPGLQSKTAKVTVAAGTLTQNFALGYSFQQEVVVGSRAAGAAAEKAVPVDVFTEQQVESASASAETAQIIERIAPSLNFPRPTISDGTDSVRPATLRSMGPDQVLVLINGKRRHTSALVYVNGTIGRGAQSVDLNAIPASAIERIEVLRDGAAAQYGSDAIAGVINIVLKSGTSPLDVGLQGGTTTHSDGEMFDANANAGVKVGTGFLNFTGEYRKRNPTNRAGRDPRDQIVAGDGGNNPVKQPNTHWGDAEERDIFGWVNGSLPLNDDASTSFYLFGGASQRDGTHGGNYRRAIQAQNWPQIYPLGFLPLIEPKIVDYSGTAGVRGVVAGAWFWDLSAQYGHDKFDFDITHTLNTSLGPDIPPNKTSFYAGALEFNQFIANLDITREVEIGLSGPLNVAVGAEFRRENYQEQGGEEGSYIDGGHADRAGNKAPAGAQVFPGFRPSNEVDASRSSYAGYVDFEADVLKFLRLGLAGRFEHYTDFGNTSDFKITARVEATKQLVFHGLPRAVARPDELLGDQHELPARQRSLHAVRRGSLPREQPARAGARRHRSPAGGFHQLQRRLRVEPVERLRPHGGLLPRRHRRPDHPFRQLHGCEPESHPRALQRDRSPLLHQRHRHDDRGLRGHGEHPRRSRERWDSRAAGGVRALEERDHPHRLDAPAARRIPVGALRPARAATADVRPAQGQRPSDQ